MDKYLKKTENPNNKKSIENAIRLLDKFLHSQRYVAETNEMSLADISTYVSISTLEVLGYELNHYPNVDKWFSLMEAIRPGQSEDKELLKQYEKWIKNAM